MLPKLPCRLFTDQLPSTSPSQLLRAIRKVDVISAMVTSVQSHSLLERLFIYPYFRHYYGYFLLDKRTNQMIGIDCGDFSVSKYHIERLKREENANLTHLFITHGHEKHSQGYISLQNTYPQVEIRSFSLPNTIKTAEGDMSFIGDLCVFPLHTPGHSEDSLTYVVTEVNDKSTKTPLVFSGDTLQIGSIGTVADAGEMYKSLLKLKSLPNETLIFPGHESALPSLQFASLLEKDNEFLSKKLLWAQTCRQQGDMTVGSVLCEERLYNPYFRCFQPHFQSLTNETDPVRVLSKLSKLQTNLKNENNNR